MFSPSRRSVLRRLLIAGGLVALLAPAAWADGAVSVDHAWARATPGPVRTGVAYLTIRAPDGDHLVSAQTPVAARAELHAMTMDGSVMRMRAVPGGLEVEPGKPLVLAPDGLHLMLMDLKHPLKEGEKFPLTLTFRKAGTIETMVTVEKAGALSGPGDAMPGMKM